MTKITTVTFSSYYKYYFTFAGADGTTWGVGGDADDIYKLSVSTDPIDLMEEDGVYYIDGYEATKL